MPDTNTRNSLPIPWLGQLASAWAAPGLLPRPLAESMFTSREEAEAALQLPFFSWPLWLRNIQVCVPAPLWSVCHLPHLVLEPCHLQVLMPIPCYPTDVTSKVSRPWHRATSRSMQLGHTLRCGLACVPTSRVPCWSASH